MEHKPIESTELRGVTPRLLTTMIIATAMLMATILGTYYSTKLDLERNRDGTEVLKLQVETVRSELKTVQVQQQTNEIRLTRIEEQIQQLQKR